MIVIGGDLAGLAAAFYARRSGRDATVFDPAPALGGHARTMEHGAFRFDTGFHWLHEHAPGRDAADPALDEMRALLGEDLQRVSATMQIAHGGRLFDFPIDTLTLARRHGARGVVRTGSELAFQRARAVFDREPVLNFEEWVTSRYGRSIAKPFFIDYAEKLFGRPAAWLSPAGVRRIDDRTATRRYPARGIGQIAEALAASCGPANVHTRAQITQIHCSPRVVTAVDVDGVTRPIVDTLVSTLPVPLLLKLMRPVPPVSVTNAASRLRFRDLRLVTLMLSRARVTAGAAVFFPGATVSVHARVRATESQRAPGAGGLHVSGGRSALLVRRRVRSRRGPGVDQGGDTRVRGSGVDPETRGDRRRQHPRPLRVSCRGSRPRRRPGAGLRLAGAVPQSSDAGPHWPI